MKTALFEKTNDYTDQQLDWLGQPSNFLHKRSHQPYQLIINAEIGAILIIHLLGFEIFFDQCLMENNVIGKQKKG